MQGAGREKAPELANVMAETARHLNGDAEPPQGRDAGTGAGRMLEEYAFRDLDDQVRRHQPVTRQGLLDAAGQRGIAQVDRRQVDRDARHADAGAGCEIAVRA